MEPSSFSGSSKRAKAPGNIVQAAHCLVDGCNADLSLCRDYHRRHKVCETHSKTPKVYIGGREQRFCQQCSRFHSLIEFDEGKRSCRKRLDGHNRRRRKPQPDALARNSGLVFPTHQTASGTRLLSFSNPQMLPTAMAGPSWPPGIVKPEHEIPIYNQHMSHLDRSNTFPEGINQLPFLHGSAVSGSSSDRALSLLSSAPPTVTREFHVQADAPLPTPAQPLPHLNLHYNDSNTGTSASTMHFPEMFQPGAEGSSSSTTSGTHQTLTFMWG